MLSWDVSVAHFNNSLCVGTLFFNKAKFTDNVGPYFVFSIVQLIGNVVGLALTWITVYEVSTDAYSKTIFPETLELCPSDYGQSQVAGNGCK